MKKHDVAMIAYEDAIAAVQRWVEKWREMEVPVTVVVVDRYMNMIAFGKDDGATPHSTFTATKKAQTAASTWQKTWWMSSEIAITLPMGTDNRMTNVLWWEPLIVDGVVVWWVWVAGGTVEQDAEVAAFIIR